MSKMHLPARVPNEGARRLAWWIGERSRPSYNAFEAFAVAIGSHVSFVDRVLFGEIVPGEDLARRIGRATGGFIDRRDWRRRPKGGWFDRPIAHYSSQTCATGLSPRAPAHAGGAARHAPHATTVAPPEVFL